MSVDLSEQEVRLLLEACRKYRRQIPSYIRARRIEAEQLDQVIARLEATLLE